MLALLEARAVRRRGVLGPEGPDAHAVPNAAVGHVGLDDVRLVTARTQLIGERSGLALRPEAGHLELVAPSVARRRALRRGNRTVDLRGVRGRLRQGVPRTRHDGRGFEHGLRRERDDRQPVRGRGRLGGGAVGGASSDAGEAPMRTPASAVDGLSSSLSI